jgi:DDE family transposase
MQDSACLPKTLRTLLTTTADALARETGFVQRERTLTGSHFAQTLVFGYLDSPDASLSGLQQSAATTGAPVSRQAISQRCTEVAATFLHRLLEAVMRERFTAPAAALPLLQRFPALAVGDSTTVTLPPALAERWPGCGGSTPDAAAAVLKIQVRWDLVHGTLDGLELQAGRASDQKAAQQTTPLVAGGLAVRDLGYFCLPQLRATVAAGGHYLTRPTPQLQVTDAQGRRRSLVQFLQHACGQPFDGWVEVGTKERLRCRLLAWPLPPAVVALRRQRLAETARRAGKRVSPTVWAVAAWTVVLTSLDRTRLRAAEALVVLRLRWQVELLFKVWKSAGGQLEQWRTADPWRALCTVYAKLVALVIQHWLLQAGGWEVATQSLVLAARLVRARASALASALRRGVAAIRGELGELRRILAACCRIGSRHARPAHHQLLLALEALS